jgi:multidrug efflux pump
LFLAGAVAYNFLPVASMPTVEFPTIRVSAGRPGADPAVMAATVAAPLERRLGAIPGVIELTSVSSLGNTRIAIQFDLNRSIDGAARDVQAALNAALRPAGRSTDVAEHARHPAARRSDLGATSKNMLASAMYEVADPSSRNAFRSTAWPVTVNGAEQPAVRIRVNPVAIASMGVSMEDVRVAAANANSTACSAHSGWPRPNHRHQQLASRHDTKTS